MNSESTYGFNVSVNKSSVVHFLDGVKHFDLKV